MKIETELTMREYDRADFPDSGEADEPACARCFSDEDISQCIEDFNGPPGARGPGMFRRDDGDAPQGKPHIAIDDGNRWRPRPDEPACP